MLILGTGQSENASQGKSWLREQAAKIAPLALSAAWGGLVFLGNEGVFFALAAAAFTAAVAVAGWGERLVRNGSLLDSTGATMTRPFLPRWSRWAACTVAVVVPPAAAVIWFGFWTAIVPLARIDGVEGSEFAGGHEEKFVHIGPTILNTEDGMTHTAYPGIRVNISRVGAGTVKIKSVEVSAKPFRIQGVWMKHTAAHLDRLTAARFRAVIPPTGGSVTCQMTDGESPILGVVLLNAESPEAILHIEADGPVDGFYAVTVRIVVADEGDRRVRRIETNQTIIVRVDHPERHPPAPPIAADELPKRPPPIVSPADQP